MLDKELNREGLAKLALDRGQISQETYNRMVPPVNPDAQVVEVTDYLPSAENVRGAVEKVIPMAGPVIDVVSGALNTPNANAEVPLRNPALDQPIEPEIPQGALSTDVKPTMQGQSAPAMANPLGGLEGALNKQKGSILEAAKLGAEQASKESAYQQKMFDESEKMRAQQIEIDAQRQEKLRGYEELLNQKMDDYAKKPANVSQVFANAGTGQKLLMGFAMFLGAAPNSSGQNKAVTAMQNAIDADLAKSKAEVGDRKNAYQEMKATFQDERQADAAARLAYLNNAQLKLNQIASQYKGPQILENAKLLNAKIDEEKEKMKMQFMAAAQASPAFQSADQVTQSIMKYPREQQKDLFEAREVWDATKAAEKEIDSIYDGFDVGAAGYIPFTDSKAKLQTEHAKIESAIRATMRGQGTIQETEIVRLVNPFLPEPTDTRSRLEIKKQQLKTLLNTKNAGQINRLKNAGILPQEKKFSESAPVKTKGK
jgi:hypothetical protein